MPQFMCTAEIIKTFIVVQFELMMKIGLLNLLQYFKIIHIK